MSFWNAFLALILVLPFSVLSFKIDASCTAKGVEGLVRDGMVNAFSMVDAASQRLKQDPYDPETTNLIAHLFMPKEGQDPNDRSKMAKVQNIFRNIGEYFREETKGTPKVTDVIIYCDSSRYEHKGKTDKLGRKIYYDTTTNTHILYKEQSCHEGLNDIPSLAVTYNPMRKHEDLDPVTNQVVIAFKMATPQIQLCPWFIDWIKDKEYKHGNDVCKRTRFGRWLIKKAESNQWLRQIDAFSLLDKVLLHEMTHARHAFIGSKGIDDLKPPGLLSFFPAYGWALAKLLAEKAPDITGLDGWSDKTPDHNSDSIALFGSACKLLDDPENPRRVLEDGRIQSIPKKQ